MSPQIVSDLRIDGHERPKPPVDIERKTKKPKLKNETVSDLMISPEIKSEPVGPVLKPKVTADSIVQTDQEVEQVLPD